MPKRVRVLAAVLVLILSSIALAQHDSMYDFKISKSFMDSLLTQNTLNFQLKARTIDHSGLHRLNADCEIHIAATPTGTAFGFPEDLVAEPPNECKIPPPGTTGHPSFNKLSDLWPARVEEVMFNGKDSEGKPVGRTCTFTGYPRIFTEHAQTGGENPSNPNHVFEIHPMLKAECDGKQLSFGPETLTVFPGMRKITPRSADACIRDRKLEIRFDSGENSYFFRESGANSPQGGRCGNFAIVEIMAVDFLRAVSGGHSAIARVSADGQSNVTLKVYTYTGTDMDTWLVDNAPVHDLGNRGANRDRSRTYAHGLITYDYFQMKKAIQQGVGDQWTEIKFPLAFVIYGAADEAPWQESGSPGDGEGND